MEVIGKTLPEAYHKSLVTLRDNGKITNCTDYNQKVLEGSMTMVVENAVAEPMISKIFPGGHHELEQYVMEICSGIFDFIVGKGENLWEYTYHQRIEEQLKFVVNELKRNPDSRRAVIDARNNEVDQKNDHPACLQHIQFMIRDGKLDMYVTMRSNDAFEAAFMNAFAFIALQKNVALELGVGVGKYEHRANSYHVYEKNFSMFYNAVEQIEKRNDLTYEYEGFYDELMQEEIPAILEKVKKLREKYGVE